MKTISATHEPMFCHLPITDMRRPVVPGIVGCVVIVILSLLGVA